MSTNDLDAVTITFPDLPSAEAAMMAREMERMLAEEAVPRGVIKVARTDAEAMDLGGALVILGGIGGFTFLEVIKGAANEVGHQAAKHLPGMLRWRQQGKN